MALFKSKVEKLEEWATQVIPDYDPYTFYTKAQLQAATTGFVLLYFRIIVESIAIMSKTTDTAIINSRLELMEDKIMALSEIAEYATADEQLLIAEIPALYKAALPIIKKQLAGEKPGFRNISRYQNQLQKCMEKLHEVCNPRPVSEQDDLSWIDAIEAYDALFND